MGRSRSDLADMIASGAPVSDIEHWARQTILNNFTLIPPGQFDAGELRFHIRTKAEGYRLYSVALLFSLLDFAQRTMPSLRDDWQEDESAFRAAMPSYPAPADGGGAARWTDLKLLSSRGTSDIARIRWHLDACCRRSMRPLRAEICFQVSYAVRRHPLFCGDWESVHALWEDGSGKAEKRRPRKRQTAKAPLSTINQ